MGATGPDACLLMRLRPGLPGYIGTYRGTSGSARAVSLVDGWGTYTGRSRRAGTSGTRLNCDAAGSRFRSRRPTENLCPQRSYHARETKRQRMASQRHTPPFGCDLGKGHPFPGLGLRCAVLSATGCHPTSTFRHDPASPSWAAARPPGTPGCHPCYESAEGPICGIF